MCDYFVVLKIDLFHVGRATNDGDDKIGSLCNMRDQLVLHYVRRNMQHATAGHFILDPGV
jgi:hypothetical protein